MRDSNGSNMSWPIAVALGGDARRKEPGGKAPGLKDNEAVIEENLGDLSGLAGAGGGLEDEAGVGS